MAENIQEYGIEIGFEDAMRKISKLRTVQKNMNRMQESSLKRQINLQSRLNALQKAGVSGMGGMQKMSTMPRQPSMQMPKTSSLASSMKQDFSTQHQKNAQFLKEQTSQQQSQVALQKAKNNILSRERLFQSSILSAKEKQLAMDLKIRVQNARTVDELRNAVAQTRHRLADSKKLEKSLKKQSYILQRMQSSSRQFAGNMVSAFAVAAGVAGITRVGQDFESVNNTMLAVSENAEVAGKNFQFVRDEAFRLGLGLKEAAKGFAKLVAAKGNMSLEDTKKLFTGVGELSTLLGLSTEESGRALNAIQQMASKGTISAEELNFRLSM